VLHATADLKRTLDRVHRLLASRGLLLLIEATRPDRHLDLVFGLTPGWWAFQDHRLRPDHPLLPAARWQSLLVEVGFADAAIVRPDGDEDTLPGQSVILARRKPAPVVPARAPAGRWRVVSDAPDDRSIIELCEQLGHQGLTLAAASPVTLQAAAAARPNQAMGTGHADIIFIPAPGPIDEASDAQGLETALRRPIEALLALVQHVAGLTDPPRIAVVTRGALAPDRPVAPVDPSQSPLAGMTRVLAREMPHLWAGLIDLDPVASDAGLQAAMVVDGLSRLACEPEIAYRAGHPLLPRLVSSPVTRREEPLRLRRDRAYVILGGLGGLGLAVARSFAEYGAGTVALVGRRPPDGAIMPLLQGVEAAGAHLVIETADIADYVPLAACLDRVEARAPIAGVIHAAGVLDDGVLLQQNWPRFAKVMAPKVKGAWNLARYFASRPVDFVVLFSSATAVLGKVGQANHAAANNFLDVLAFQLRSRGLPVQVVDWGAWRDIGAASQQVERAAGAEGFRPIAPQAGMSALADLIAAGVDRRVVLPVNWPAYFARHPDEAEHSLLTECVNRTVHPAGATTAAVAGDLAERLLSVAPADRPKVIRERVTELAAQVLGIDRPDQLSPRQPLGELGLDSLMALQLSNALARVLGRTLPATLLFDYPTVAKLADYLAVLLLPETSPAIAPISTVADDVSADLEAIEQLSDEAATVLLDRIAAAPDRHP